MNKELQVTYAPGHLDIKKFSRMLDSPSQCYKFYWLEAILQLLKDSGDRCFRYEEIIDLMIANAWYTVTMYHLHLGPGRINNEHSDKVEDAVLSLKRAAPSLSETARKQEVIKQLHIYDREVIFAKTELTKNVPYRLLSPFLTVADKKSWYKKERMIELISRTAEKIVLPYTILNADNVLDCRVVVNDQWADWMLMEYPILIDWINFNKVIFLQGRNPEVPGIIYKLEPPYARNLNDIKKLWNSVLDHVEIHDIYSGRLLNEEKYDIDHFVPWSYVAMDEIWNLIPADKSCNTSKNNRLPDWDKYSSVYLEAQYKMYTQIFRNEDIYSLFRKCAKKNLNSQWAIDQLYIPGKQEEEFKGILGTNLKRLYDSAIIQGYGTWKW
ncbi:MAG: hypothetical protein K6F23_03135 [Solobacterium sp.]|nr:hypothetical protein [Solobacterium sp.]